MASLKFKKLKEKHFRIKDPISGYDKKFVLKTFRLPNGALENFFIDKAKDSVQIFAITPDDNVICVENFRAGPEKVQLELPGGGVEKDENPLMAAGRELLEETGFESQNELVPLCSLDYSPYSTGKRHTVMATNCHKVAELNLDPNEFLKVVILPLEAFKEKLRHGLVRGMDAAYIALERLGKL